MLLSIGRGRLFPSILCRHDFRRFDDGVGGVALLEFQLFGRLHRDRRCDDDAITEIELNIGGGHAFDDCDDLSL